MPVKHPDKQIAKEISKEKEISKDTKDHKEKLEKEHKEGHKEKSEKLEKHEKLEKLEKHEHKELVKSEFETLPSQSVDPGPEQVQAEALSAEKFTDKLFSVEKAFKAEYEKHPKLEKIEIWEKHRTKIEKIEKIEYEYYGPAQPVGDPGPVEQRLAALEAAIAQLAHFIPKEQRPDLSKGALKQEPDVPAAKPAEEKKK